MSSLHSWLPVALPADARRIRVSGDDDLAETLAEAGAELVADRPDVEIATRRRDLRHDADTAILLLGSNQPDGGTRLLRVRRRVTGSASARGRAQLDRAALRAHGYAKVTAIPWDYDQPVQIPGGGGYRRGVLEMLPERVVVVAHRRTSGETLLERVASKAAALIGAPVRYRWPLSRAGVLVTVADSCVLRIAVGPASSRLIAQGEILAALADGPAEVSDRVPQPMTTGTEGLGTWSVEPRIAGATMAGAMPESILWDCVDFLVALHGIGPRTPARSIAADARRCAERCVTDRQRGDLIALGEELDVLLADVPRGFGHGDFWMGNLLRDGDHLCGVIDWDGGGPGRLPLVDLVHLQVSGVREGTHLTLGHAILESRLQAAREGGDPVMRAYCERIGLDPDPAILEGLVLAFWIERNALELDLRPDIITDTWIGDNITHVLTTLRHEGRLPRGDAPRR